MAVYVCGDTHIPINISKLNKTKWKSQEALTKEDILIILGDCGLLWDAWWSKEELYWAKWLAKKNCTVCFIDGNHENFDRLNSLPEVNFKEAKAGLAFSNDDGAIYHLKRGQIYEMCDHKILTIGGATSVDKAYRTEYRSWWPQETLTRLEEIFIDSNLKNNKYDVDIILTHTCCSKIASDLAAIPQECINSKFFDYVEEKVTYSKWYFGHFHHDLFIDDKHVCMFNMPPLKIC
jgi:DNA repair exonuclease SbcCD nuclease subunit